MDPAARCEDGTCVLPPATGEDVRVLWRLPANAPAAPGALVVGEPRTSPLCEACVALGTSYLTDHGIFVPRELAAALGWSTGTDVIVPARATIESLIEGVPIRELVPSPLGARIIEPWTRPSGSSAGRSPTGETPRTARAAIFEGTYARTLDAEPPFDAVLPPLHGTFSVPLVEGMFLVTGATLRTVVVRDVELPRREAGWQLFLVGPDGTRRSSTVACRSWRGRMSFAVEAATTPAAMPLDLAVVPGDESLSAPRLIVPTPEVLPLVGYPTLPASGRVTVRVVEASGGAVAGALVVLDGREVERASAEPSEVFASYVRTVATARTNAEGYATFTAPRGVYVGTARKSDGPRLLASPVAEYSVLDRTTSIRMTVAAPRVVEGTCTFVGGRALSGAAVEARMLNGFSAPLGYSRAQAATAGDGSFHLDLPEGRYALRVRPPDGAPMYEAWLGEAEVGGAARTQVPCRLRAPVRRELSVIDGAPGRGAPVASAIVETFRLVPGKAPEWLGEGISRADGHVTIYEAP